MNFKQFLQEVKRTNTGEGDFGYDTPEGRQYEYERFKENGSKIGNIEGQPVYKLKAGSGLSFAVLDEENESIDFMSQLEIDEEILGVQGYSQSGIWKDRLAKFQATDVINIILNEVKLLISDRYQTDDGKKLWTNLFKSYGYIRRCGVYNPRDDSIIEYKDLKSSDKIKQIIEIGYDHKDLVFFMFK